MTLSDMLCWFCSQGPEGPVGPRGVVGREGLEGPSGMDGAAGTDGGKGNTVTREAPLSGLYSTAVTSMSQRFWFAALAHGDSCVSSNLTDKQHHLLLITPVVTIVIICVIIFLTYCTVVFARESKGTTGSWVCPGRPACGGRRARGGCPGATGPSARR